MEKLISIEDYKESQGIKDLEIYSSGRIDAKAYVRQITPTHINKESVRLNLLTVSQLSKNLSESNEKEVQAIETGLNAKNLYSLTRKYAQ